MKIALLLVVLVVYVESFDLFGVSMVNHYENDTLLYTKFETVSVDPVTGGVKNLMTNFVHPSPHYNVLFGVAALDTDLNRLYFAPNLHVDNENSHFKMVLGSDLENDKLLPTVAIDSLMIIQMVYDSTNKRLLMLGFNSFPPNEENSGVLLSYSFTTFQSQLVYQFTGFTEVAEIEIDSEAQKLYFLAVFNKTEQIGTYDLNTQEVGKLVIPDCGNTPFNTVPNTLMYHAEIGLSALGLSLDAQNAVHFHYMTFSMNGQCNIHKLPLSGMSIVSNVAFDVKSNLLYITYSDEKSMGNLMTYNTKTFQVEKSVIMSPPTFLIEMRGN